MANEMRDTSRCASLNGRAVSAFPVATAPSSDKLRGGYYTPQPIAEFLAEWVSGAGQRVLEPSCGNGALLQPLGKHVRHALGIELEPEEAQKARVTSGAEVIEADFFRWFSATEWGQWDGVAGNPPFIRFQNWTEPTRGLAFDLMRAVGLRPTKLTNAWVPFVVGSTLALRDGGRLGLVVPAELLQVTYAAQLRGFLVDQYTDLTAVTFRRLVFEGILQEVVLLLGVRGDGPACIRVVEVEDGKELDEIGDPLALPHAPALRHETEKWTKYLLPPSGIEALRAARTHPRLARLGDIADVDVGVVTGRNRFFVMTPTTTMRRSLGEHVIPLVSKSAHLRGIRFDHADMHTLRDADAPCDLLAVSAAAEVSDDAPLRSYIAAGEVEAVHQGYKCSIRKRWWVVPSIWTPHAFLLRQIYDHPRIIANDAGAISTDTIHRVRMRNGTPPDRLAAASINSATFAFAEIIGRSYGGGVLELEPREAEDLPFPDPDALPGECVAAVDALVRSRDLVGALDLVDRRLLVDALGFDPALVTELRGVWERLRDRRLARGKRTT